MIFSCRQCGELWAPSYDAFRRDAKENSIEKTRKQSRPRNLLQGHEKLSECRGYLRFGTCLRGRCLAEMDLMMSCRRFLGSRGTFARCSARFMRLCTSGSLPCTGDRFRAEPP